MIKIIFVPGNGGCSTQDNWFPGVKTELEKHDLEVIAATFPDPILAREQYWLPFLRAELKADKDTVLIGHSSGAIAAMRFAEKYELLGSVLVGAYHTHLNIETEKQSGYFDRPWDFDKVKANQKWISLFASSDDPWIPIEEPRYLHEQLDCEYHEYKNQGHFGGDYYKSTFPELCLSVLSNLKRLGS